MEVILHIGAQRTATTTFQSYLREHGKALTEQGVSIWGPLRTRHGGMLSGIAPDADAAPDSKAFDAARRRINRQLEAMAQRGQTQLIVSDENMLGTIRVNLRASMLYPGAADRLRLFAQAFDGTVSRVVLSVRALEDYWASAWSYAVERGYRLPGASSLAQTARQPRSWQHVIQDVAGACDGTGVMIFGHQGFAGRPEERLRHILNHRIEPPSRHSEIWRHRGPDLPTLRAVLRERGEDPGLLPAGNGRWTPFTNDQIARLRETYDDDRFWLHAGAGGLATFIEEDQPDQAGKNLPGGAIARGLKDDRQDGNLARAG